jgi:L-threonylcarbamoyladenylate synthase
LTGKIAFSKYAEFIRKGKIALFPTDTVVGIGCRFDSKESIAGLRAIKGIRDSDPIAVLISTVQQLDILKIRRSRLSNLLAEKFWPGGLTLVLSSDDRFPCSGSGNTLGLRMPDVDSLRKIIEMAGVPLAATSANFHGQPSPDRMEKVDASILDSVDGTFDIPASLMGLPSTVVKFEGGEIKIIREGAIPSRDIYDAVAEES